MMRRTPSLLSALLLGTLLCFVQVPAALAQGVAPGAPTSYTLVGRATAGGTVLGTLALGNVTSFAGPGPNGVFVLTLVASNAAGNGPESAAVTVTLPTLPAPPGAPTNLVASTLGNTATFT